MRTPLVRLLIVLLFAVLVREPTSKRSPHGGHRALVRSWKEGSNHSSPPSPAPFLLSIAVQFHVCGARGGGESQLLRCRAWATRAPDHLLFRPSAVLPHCVSVGWGRRAAQRWGSLGHYALGGRVR